MAMVQFSERIVQLLMELNQCRIAHLSVTISMKLTLVVASYPGLVMKNMIIQ